MKRKEFVRFLMRNGCVLIRHGASHGVWLNPVSGKKQPLPRHSEIDDISTRTKVFRYPKTCEVSETSQVLCQIYT